MNRSLASMTQTIGKRHISLASTYCTNQLLVLQASLARITDYWIVQHKYVQYRSTQRITIVQIICCAARLLVHIAHFTYWFYTAKSNFCLLNLYFFFFEY